MIFQHRRNNLLHKVFEDSFIFIKLKNGFHKAMLNSVSLILRIGVTFYTF